MPKIIVTSRYIKASESSHKAFYVKYIGTREGTIFDTSHGSIPTPENAEKIANIPPTKKQKELIGEVLKEFKDAKEMFEYADYIANPTIASASSFLTAVFDRNADIVLGKTAYVHYLGERPGVVLASGTQHGLFTSDSGAYIDIDALADEVAHHKGNVWTHVVSLRREDARNVGYAFDDPQITAEAWRGLVRNHIQKIAENTKIAPENLKWYAAFHNKETNPHVHIMVYSKDPKEGFLTNRGIENIRSSFANDIYSAELTMLNEKQTELRNLLKSEAAETFQTIKSKWLSGRYEDGDELISSISKLRSQLADYKGRKVYKYMKPEVKDTIDDIARILYRNEDVQKLYGLWCECQSERISIYTSAQTEFPKLEDNTEFKSIKNMILREVFDSLEPNYALPQEPVISVDYNEREEPPLDVGADYFHGREDYYVPQDMDFEEIYENFNESYAENEPIPLPDEPLGYADYNNFEEAPLPVDETYLLGREDINSPGQITYEKENDYIQSKIYIKWSNNFKYAQDIIRDISSEAEDISKAEKILITEAHRGNVLASSELGKLYASERLGLCDTEKSELYYKRALEGYLALEPAAGKLQGYIQYRLGNIYTYGLGTDIDEKEAFEWLTKGAESGNKYASFSLGNIYYYGNSYVEKDAETAHKHYSAAANKNMPYASYALGKMYGNNEVANIDTAQASRLSYTHYEKALHGFLAMENQNADDMLLYKIGMMYKYGYGTDIDLDKATDYFRRSAKLNNKYALYEYGKTLCLSDHEEDRKTGLSMLEKSVELGNDNAKRYLGVIYLEGKITEQNVEKGLQMLTDCADKGDGFAMYRLGKYYDGADNTSEAVKWFKLSCEKENISKYATYSLAKIYLREDTEYFNVDEAVRLLEKSIELDNDNAMCKLGIMYLYGKHVDKDIERGMELLKAAEERGNEFAKQVIESYGQHDYSYNVLAGLNLFASFTRMFNDNHRGDNRLFIKRSPMSDRLTQIKELEKKQAQGMRIEQS